MACAVDEVTSIVFIATLIFQVCDTLKIKPTPFVIIGVLATNIGSTGTMLGNPVGILIGQKASPPLSFVDFITCRFRLCSLRFRYPLSF
jgi:Na+/H+ antiporter NhaD/arsenite permease-like protein